MNKLLVLNVSNHDLTEEQIFMIEKYFNREIDVCLKLPLNLSEKFRNLPDNTKDRLELIYEILKWIEQMADYFGCDIGIHVDGEAHFVYLLVNQIKKWLSNKNDKYEKTTIFKFYSERRTIEEKQEDGSVKKVSIFKPKTILEY